MNILRMKFCCRQLESNVEIDNIEKNSIGFTVALKQFDSRHDWITYCGITHCPWCGFELKKLLDLKQQMKLHDKREKEEECQITNTK